MNAHHDPPLECPPEAGGGGGGGGGAAGIAGKGARVGKGASVGRGIIWIELILELIPSVCSVGKSTCPSEVKVGIMVGTVKGWMVGQGVGVAGELTIVGVAEGEAGESPAEAAWLSR